MLSQIFERYVSFFLAVLMVFSLMPVSALATDEVFHDHDHTTVEETVQTTRDPVVTEEPVVTEIPSVTPNPAIAECQAEIDRILATYQVTTDMTEDEIISLINDEEFDYLEALGECDVFETNITEAYENGTLAVEEIDMLVEKNQVFVTFSSALTARYVNDGGMNMFAAEPNTYSSGTYADDQITAKGGYYSGKGNCTAGTSDIKVTSGSGMFSSYIANITVINASGKAGEVFFDYSASNYSSFTFGGESASKASGSYRGTMSESGTLVVAVEGSSGLGAKSASLTLSNFKFTVAQEKANVTVEYDGTCGSVTANGSAVSSGDAVKGSVTESVKLVATPTNDGTFLGWTDTSGLILSSATSYTVTPATDMTIKAVFVGAGSAPHFYVGSATQKTESVGLLGMSKLYYYEVGKFFLFDNLNGAVAAATASSTEKVVVLANSGTLGTGTYTIPAGVTLLIPFNDVYTMYTTEAQSIDPKTYTTPTEFRTLTMADGANLVVEGAISVSSSTIYASGGYNGGCPTGPCGFVRMQGNSSITVNSGGSLYAYGYITGSGAVTANSGATVYECFQIMDFRGGTQSTDMQNEVFPLSQYYVQNIEVPLTLNSGANEYVFTTIYMSSTKFPSSVLFVGKVTESGWGSSESTGMFDMQSGKLIKRYDGTTDRLIIEMQGTGTLSNIKLEVGTSDIDSASYDLALTSNISVSLTGTGTEVALEQDIAMLPGAEMIIDEGVTLTLGSGKNVFIYDSDTWGTYAFGKGADGANKNYKFIPLEYVPGRSYNRTEADLKDALVLVNGTVDATAGNIYTTTSGANIYTESSGVVTTKAGTQTVTYQLVQGTGYTEIPITPAKLKNADGTYTETASATDATTYEYCEPHGVWYTGECEACATKVEYTISWDTNGDGTVDDTTTVEAGTMPTHADGSKAATAEYTYTFTGWSPAIAAAAGNVTYTAQFSENPKSYTVTWMVDGEAYETETYAYGAALTQIAAPTKEGYTFSGWSTLPATMPANDVTVTGNFSVNNYTVTWLVDGVEHKTETYAYGAALAQIAAPTKEGYTFSGWSTLPTTMPAENVTVTGTFTVNNYTISWDIDGDGVVDDTTTVAYGTVPSYADPTKAADGCTSYTFKEWSPALDAVTGEATYTATYTETTNHSYGKITYVWDELQCTATRTCGVCNAPQTASVTGTVVTVEATHTKKGSVTYTATFTGDDAWAASNVKVEEIPAQSGNHTYENWTQTKAPTCTEPGEKTGTCVCGQTSTQTIPKTNHEGTTEERAQIDATCVTTGNEAGTYCTACNKYISGGAVIDIDPTAHSFTKYTYNNDAKCGVDGTETATCDRDGCNETDTREKTGTALAHVDVNRDHECDNGCDVYQGTHADASDDKDHVCDYCKGEIENGETCSDAADDSDHLCDVCGAACGNHDYNKKVATESHKATAATCVASATYYYSCDCGAHNDQTFAHGSVDSTNHVNKEEKAKQEPTCVDVGYEAGVYCNDCKTWVSGHDTITALNHEMTKVVAEKVEATCTTTGTTAVMGCTRCDYTEGGAVIGKLSHTMEHHDRVDATCVATGNVEYWSCSGCGLNYSNEAGTTKLDTVVIEINESAHDLKHVEAQKATCEQIGWEAYDECQREGCEYTTYKEIAQLVHKFDGEIKDLENGKHGWKCTNPGCAVYGNETDHTFGDWQKSGDKHWKQCECGAKSAEAGHDWANDCDTTCDTCGQTREVEDHKSNADHPCQDGKCIHCGADVPATEAHDWVDADCDTPKTCKTCGKTEGEALGHAYEEKYNYTDDEMGGCTFTATRTCKNGCELNETAVGTVVGDPAEIEGKEANCVDYGRGNYTVSFDVDWAEEYVYKNLSTPKDSTNHKALTEHSAVAPTCTQNGQTAWSNCPTSRGGCGTTITPYETTEALGHNYGEPVWQWTATAESATCTVTFTCTRNGCTDNTDGHTIQPDVTVVEQTRNNATCKEAGSVTYTATVKVGETDYSDSETAEIPTVAHSFNSKDSGQKATDASCTAKQTNYVRCDNCDAVSETKTIEIGELAEHTYEVGKYVSNENNHWQVCTVCGQSGGAVNHIPENDDGDCTTSIVCSVCGATTTEARESHIWVEGKCTVCQTECKHIWENGTCATCGAVESISGTLSVSTVNLSLGSVVRINAYYNFTGFTEDYLAKNGGIMVWKDSDHANHKLVTIDSENIQIIPGLYYDETRGKYAGQSNGIAAYDLGVLLRIRAYVKMPDGTYVYSDPSKGAMKMSPQTYAEKLLNDATQTDEAKAMVVAMLNYGAAAQQYFFGDSATLLVNGNLSDVQKQMPTWDSSWLDARASFIGNKNFAQDKTVFPYQANNLQPEESVSINYKFTIADAYLETAQEYGFLLWTREDYLNAAELTKETATVCTELAKIDGLWQYRYEDITPLDYGTTLYSCAYLIDDNGVYHYSGLLRYSVDRYVQVELPKSSTSDTLEALLKWLIIYGEKTTAYVLSAQ